MQNRPSQRVVARLADEVENAGMQNLLPHTHAAEISEALRGQATSAQVELAVPKEVRCSSQTVMVKTNLVRCRRCGKITDIVSSAQIVSRPRCPSCGSETVPSPIWAITTTPLIQTVLTEDSRVPLVLSLEDYSQQRQLGRVTRCYISNLSRPITGLRIDTTQTTNQTIDPHHRLGSFRYSLSMSPTEGMVRPISITAFAYEEEGCSKVSPIGGELNGIEEVLFCRGLEVLQVTPAYRIGHPRFSSSYRVPVVSYSRNSRRYVLFTRHFRTDGLIIKADRQALLEAAEAAGIPEAQRFWTALHTLSHAFLVKLPQATGLEGASFSEALSVPYSEIAVFDNSPGGLGGTEGVLITGERALNLNPNFELFLRRAWDCPLACLRACKACLFSDSCYMLNWRLDRRVLINLGWG